MTTPTQNDPDEGDVGDEPSETDEAVEPHEADLDIHISVTSCSLARGHLHVALEELGVEVQLHLLHVEHPGGGSAAAVKREGRRDIHHSGKRRIVGSKARTEINGSS